MRQIGQTMEVRGGNIKGDALILPAVSGDVGKLTFCVGDYFQGAVAGSLEYLGNDACVFERVGNVQSQCVFVRSEDLKDRFAAE